MSNLSEKTRKHMDELSQSTKKKFGEESLHLLGGSNNFLINVIPTGSISLDVALGVGGIPRGRIIEIYGPESSGKTTLCQHIVAVAQFLGGYCVFIDTEHALDPVYAEKCGIKINDLFVSQPDSGEQALEIADEALNHSPMLIVIDSVAGLVPRAEIEGQMGDSVTYDTPIYVRNVKTKQIEIVPIASLYGGSQIFLDNHYQSIYRKLKSYEVLTHSGWESLNAVVYKKNRYEKETIITHTRSGYVKTTPDHCLFQNQQEVTPGELVIGDLIDVYDNKILIESEVSLYSPSLAWLIGLWVGDGQIVEANKNNLNRRFSYGSIDLDLINKIENVLKGSFGVNVKIGTPKIKGNRKQLYQLITTSSKRIGNFLEEAYCTKTDLKKVPAWVLNGTEIIRKSFLDGFYLADGNHHSDHKYKAYYNNSLSVIAGVQYLLRLNGTSTNLTFSENRFKQLTLSERNKEIPNEIKRIVHTNEKEEFLYDIETGSGTFVTALGNIVVHNSHMALQARLMSQALRKLSGRAKKSNTTIIFTNQLRQKIGVMFGSPETTTGGEALKFWASVRLDCRGRTVEKGKTEEDKEGVSRQHVITVKKNKVAPPFKKANLTIRFGEGLSLVDELIDYVDAGSLLNFAEKAGPWYTIKNEPPEKISGRANFREYLLNNPAMLLAIENALRSNLRLPLRLE